MKILAIESSCDETAAAVVADGGVVLSNVVVSQVDIFAVYGGVIPEVAARSHLEAIMPVIHKALEDAGLTKDEIDYIAVTHTPGLMGSLLIGTLTARMLAILWRKPLYAVHHLKSHIYANWLRKTSKNLLAFSGHDVDSSRRHGRVASSSSVVTSGDSLESQKILANLNQSVRMNSSLPENNAFSTSSSQPIRVNLDDLDGVPGLPSFPLLALVVSGGHTQIIYMREHNNFEIIGTTRDDAVGECFDKVAKVLGLPYPGGPSIAKCAVGSDFALSSESVNLSESNPSSRGRDSDPVQPYNTPQTTQNLTQQHICKYDGHSDNSSPNLQVSCRKREWYKEHPNYRLPIPKVEGLDFSFSGLKTAVLRAVQAELGLPITTPSYELAEKLTETQKADFAAAFQEMAAEILVEKLELALEMYPEVKSVVVAGGVSANEVLKNKTLGLETEQRKVYFPELKYAGDNAAMVGAAAYYEIVSGVEPTDPYKLNIAPRTDIK